MLRTVTSKPARTQLSGDNPNILNRTKLEAEMKRHEFNDQLTLEAFEKAGNRKLTKNVVPL